MKEINDTQLTLFIRLLKTEIIGADIRMRYPHTTRETKRLIEEYRKELFEEFQNLTGEEDPLVYLN